MTHAKKHLGQNFLKAQPVVNAMVSAVSPDIETIVEVGPGKGALTKDLVTLGKRVAVIEKDAELIPLLHEKFANHVADKTLEIQEGDILDWQPGDLQNYAVVANIPFYITGAIIEFFLSLENKPREMVLLMQKEVADRILKKDGKESVLSVAVGVYGESKRVMNVSRRAFTPAPNVDCAVIKISDISNDFFVGISEKEFFGFVKQGFSHKRKKLVNNLAEQFQKESILDALTETGLPETVRAEEITKDNWRKLFVILSSGIL
jgi:16S rRNA (adenine1518-N6/adenine1519-N6)-dimethyltransferase